jgi:pantetheine-phosphate adenylyltransferase
MSVIMPGSYDPVTLGHAEMIRRVAEREEEVHVVMFSDPNKEYMF